MINSFFSYFEFYNNKPLAPHLSVYLPQNSSLSSIFHRFSGLFMVIWLIYKLIIFVCFSNLFIQFLLIPILKTKFLFLFDRFLSFCFLLSLTYHFFNGIRLIIWSFGYGITSLNLLSTNLIVLVIVISCIFFYW